MASDGIIMPLPPSNLDFASSAQFWDLFKDLADEVNSLTQGDVTDFGNFMGAVIDGGAFADHKAANRLTARPLAARIGAGPLAQHEREVLGGERRPRRLRRLP